jgi:hypothetical protein
MVGSRFTSSAEANYSPVEGECLGVADSLQKTKYYTQGCDKLVVGVDHKPLLGVLNEKCLEKIDNPRLRKLKEKTLGWRFSIVHIPGRQLGGPDALSRSIGARVSTLPPGRAAGEGAGRQAQVALLQTPQAAEVEGDEQDEQSCKEARHGILSAMRGVMSREHTTPDPSMDVSGELLASMELGVKSITWEMVKNEVNKDPNCQMLAAWITGGCQGPLTSMPATLHPYWRVKHSLRVLDGVPMLEERTVIPVSLRRQVLETLHSAHQGITGMMLRAELSVYWPGYASDITEVRNRCSTCHKIAPSQARLPPVEPVIPNYPFEHVCVDYMSLNGASYGVFVDRYTGWPGVYRGDAAKDVVTFLRQLCEDYGVPVTCSTDGGSNLVAKLVEDFMQTYGIHHRVSSVANPHANTRAELGVKTVKRLLRENVTIHGKLESAKFSRALLQYRNTPDRDTKMSPAMALFGRELRDFLPRPGLALMGDMWTGLASAREQALARRSTEAREKWSLSTKLLQPLGVGDSVFIQNQLGNHPRKWDKRGTVVKVEGFDQYQIMVDGSRRLTRRNRKFLRKFQPFKPDRVVEEQPGQVQPKVGGQPDSRVVQKQPVRAAVGPAVKRVGRSQDVRPVRAAVEPAVQPMVVSHDIPAARNDVQEVPGPRVGSTGAAEPVRGLVIQPLSNCPAQGGSFRDLLDYCIPTQQEGQDMSGNQQGQAGGAPDGGPLAGGVAHPVNGEDRQPRRSTRSNKGQTKKYDDFEQ